MNNALYNTIGKTYDSTRRPDPVIVQILLRLLKPSPEGDIWVSHAAQGITRMHWPQEGFRLREYENDKGDYLFISGEKS